MPTASSIKADERHKRQVLLTLDVLIPFIGSRSCIDVICLQSSLYRFISLCRLLLRTSLRVCTLHLVLSVVALPSWSEAADRSLHEQGRAIYNYRCYFCHGYSGDARTLASRFLSPPPRDFVSLTEAALSRQEMLDAVTNGKPGTAMTSFRNTLSRSEIAAVVDFVRHEFIQQHLLNTRYHTVANGWPDHERYREAYPFARGELALDARWETLTDSQRRGRSLFVTSCISCHDRSWVEDPVVVWERQALSYPRFDFQTGDFLRPPDAYSGASPFARHDIPLALADLSDQEKRGELLYLDNCAFCHAADGTAANWIGRFLEPHPRDLTDPSAMEAMTATQLRFVIAEGVPGTSMPAWQHVLERQQIEDLVAYIRRAFHPLVDQ